MADKKGTGGPNDMPGMGNTAPAPDETYTIRRFRPNDAPGVTQCVRETYGESYPGGYLYDPPQIIERNSTGRLISVVAVSDATGEIAGYGAVERYDSGTTAESGQDIVAPAHRGRSLMGRMVAFLDEEAIRVGLRRLMGHPVTSHTATQIITERQGWKICGLALGSMPDTLDFKNITGVVAQRESCLVATKFLVPPGPVIVCAPSHHRGMIERIYAEIERPAVFQAFSPISGHGEIAVSTNPSWGTGDIHVRRAGPDTPAAINKCLTDLCTKGSCAVVYLELPFDRAGADEICRTAEDIGFFFAAVGPSSVADGMDSLYLQYLNTELNLSYIQIAAPFAKQIFEYVAKERKRVGATGHYG